MVQLRLVLDLAAKIRTASSIPSEIVRSKKKRSTSLTPSWLEPCSYHLGLTTSMKMITTELT